MSIMFKFVPNRCFILFWHILFFTFVCSQIHAKEKIQTVCALLAYDSITNIKTCASKDIQNFHTIIHAITENLPVQAFVKTIHGQALYSSNVEQWAHSLSKKKPHIVIVYYSGHGSKIPDNLSPWPYMLFPCSKEKFPTQHILDILSQLQSRLTIVLLDCCNAKIPRFLQTKQLSNKQVPGLRTLFFETKGTIVAVSASPGTLSFAHKSGSIFTSYFVKTLLASAQSSCPTWEEIFNQTHKCCAPYQKPYFEIKYK